MLSLHCDTSAGDPWDLYVTVQGTERAWGWVDSKYMRLSLWRDTGVE